MSGGQAWTSSLRFTDRLAVVIEIANQLRKLNAALSTVEARRQAKEVEEQIYQSATSKAGYEEACDNACRGGNETLLHDVEVDSLTYPPLPPSALEIGIYQHATHYRDGLFSTVYRAEAPNGASDVGPQAVVSEKVVALKVTSPSMMVDPHNSEREGRILRNVRHENVVPLIDLFHQAGGRLVLVFPFCPYDLDALLRQGRIDLKQAKSHCRNLFQALSFLHARGIIHRDVKPSNILLKSPSGPAYLADFGIAWSPDDSASEDSEAKITDVGTTSYRPPELLFGNRSYGCSLDLWAAGCVVAEVASLNHQPLFTAGDLGSELALIQSIFQSLGTPTLETWPEAVHFPDWGKMAFHDFPTKSWNDLLPKASSTARDLVSNLVRYESGDRLTAKEALKHPYLME